MIDASLPALVTRWAIKRVNPDGTSRNGFVWPVGVGGVVEQDGPADGDPCGEGLHVAKTARGASQGGSLVQAIGVLVEFDQDDVLGEDADKVRVSRCRVLPGVVDLVKVWDADLRGADLRRADLSGADLAVADLSDAYLSRAYLRRADLSGADLSGADLSDADLRGADLRGAYLSGAYLRGADLRGAYLSGADLAVADFSGANLSRADLSGVRNADLAGAIGVRP